MRNFALLAAALALLASALGLKGHLLGVPEAPRAVQAGEFDTARAIARLRRVLGDERPHPVDSAANDTVRERLISELRAAGLSPRVTDQMACNGDAGDRTVSCARIRNVLVTVGPAEGRHLLMVAHYDSVPVGPGAADDGIGVSVLIEVAALLRDAPLRRPITFLFNEGEETGLIGARAFLDHNPLAGRVDALVNLESRGVTGPAIMFETSRPNARAVSHFARSAPRPVANSLTTDFYALVPNRSDVTVLKERDWTILNIAIIGNEARYHTAGDELAALDANSVAHMGEQALALARDFATRPWPGAGGELLYADLLGRTLVQIPVWLGQAMLWALLAGFAFIAWRRREGVARGAGAILLSLADAALTVFLLQSLVGLVRSGEWWRAHPGLISTAIDVTALVSAAAALFWLAGRAPLERLRIAFWLVFLALGALLGLAAPGSAIYFILPPLVAGAGLLIRRGATALALAAWAILFVSWVPLLDLSQELLDFDAGWTFAPIAALLAIPLLIELVPLTRRTPEVALAGTLGAAVLLAWLPAALAPAYSEDRKQRFSIEYFWDDSRRQGRWLVYHDGADLPEAFRAATGGPFERGFEPPWSERRRWAAPAAGAPAVAPPAVERLGELRTPAGRRISLRLAANGAETIRLQAPPAAALRAVRAGSAVRRFGDGKEGDDFVLRCHGRSCDGLVVELLSGSSAPFELSVIGMRSGLPEAARALVAARPATAQPQYAPDATYSLSRLRL